MNWDLLCRAFVSGESITSGQEVFDSASMVGLGVDGLGDDRGVVVN